MARGPVLSIGKLAVGQAEYYLDQAVRPVTRTGAVRSGVEDYHLAGVEAAGGWAGARRLGLGGEVDALRLDRVLTGEDPATGEPLGRVVARRVPGFDLRFSAPKSVSVQFGVGDDRLREATRDAQDRAVEEALAYVERAAGVTRRGAGGASVIAGRGLVAAAFRHRTSRAGDPQLHTHVLVANLILGADGRWGTIDGRRTTRRRPARATQEPEESRRSGGWSRSPARTRGTASRDLAPQNVPARGCVRLGRAGGSPSAPPRPGRVARSQPSCRQAHRRAGGSGPFPGRGCRPSGHGSTEGCCAPSGRRVARSRA
jgi:hypothetical protein